MDYLIELQHDVDIARIDTHGLEQLAARTLAAEGVAKPAELSILLADDPTVHQLNRQYRDTDAPTDVLSFGQGEGEPFSQPEGAVPHLGDVIISVDTARRQAGEYGVTLGDELAHLLVHGILHLLGYDHALPDDEARMRAREDAILGDAARHH